MLRQFCWYMHNQQTNQIKIQDQCNFIGNIEANELFLDKADVIVCDGFTGNVVIKALESAFNMIIKNEALSKRMQGYFYETQGGAPILGVNGTVVIGHGISKEKAVKGMIKLIHSIRKSEVTEKIKSAFELVL